MLVGASSTPVTAARALVKGSVLLHRLLFQLDGYSFLRPLFHRLVLLPDGLSSLIQRRVTPIDFERFHKYVVKGDMTPVLGWQCLDNGVGLIYN
jgi:hypothetical protein